MNIIAKNIEMSNCVAVFPERFFLPEPSVFMSLFGPEDLKGANFADDPVMRLKVFDLPFKKFKYIFENNRMRIEEYGFKEPNESKCTLEIRRIISGIYNNLEPVAYGFNYDTIYRFDSVLPQRDILAQFISPAQQDLIKDFGWQYTVAKDKGQKLATYFFKVVTPIELRVHANYHFNISNFPLGEKLQEQFEKCYTDIDKSLDNLSF